MYNYCDRRGLKMVFEKIKEIIIDELGIDESKITMDARFREDLGADSLDAVEIIMQIEEEFGVEINEEVIQDMKVIGDIVKYIEENK
jgi:acyl carrier protein